MPLFANRYDLQAPLGGGATSTVYRALDRETHRVVALKRLTLDDPAAHALFRQEYHAMRRLDHPGLVAAYALGDGYFTMELVDGPELPAGALPLEALRTVVASVCAVLAYMHGQGYVHGDLKPENLRYDGEGALRLLDLGFLQPAGRPGARRGTLAYMAPEVIKGEPADPRSDLWALGVIAYQALTGRLPFEARHPLALLEAQTTRPPEPLSALRPDLPPAVAEALMACLAPDPARRPPSAGHLLARLGWGQADTAYLLFGSAIFGREADLAAAEERLAAQREGQEAALALTGPAGVGKSRLLLELASPAARVPALLATGRGDTPYQLLDELLAAAEPLMEDRGLALSGEAWLALRELRPAWGAPPPRTEPQAQEARLRQALMALLSALAGETGLTIALDDWDLADRASRDLLAPFLSRANRQQLAWVLVRAQAPEQAPALALSPLAEPAVRELVASALAETPPESLAALVVERAAGVPGRVRTLLSHALRTGALFQVDGRWRFEAERLTALPAEGEARAIAELPDDAREVAQSAAVLGPGATLGELARLVEGDLFGPLAALEAAGLVSRAGERLGFLGLGREAVLGAMPEAVLKDRHARAAALFAEQADLGGRTRYARHALAAQLPEAPEALLMAARANLAVGALAPAQALLESLEPLAQEEARRLEVALALGDIHRMRGEAEAANARYEVAIALARATQDDPALCRALVSASRVAMTQAAHDRARAGVAEALPICRACGEVGQQARALMTVGRVAFFKGERAEALAAYEEALALADAAGDLGQKAYALSFLGVLRDDATTRDLLTEAVALHRQVGNPFGVIEAAINLGDRLLAAGDLVGAEPVLVDGLATCRQVGAFDDEAFMLLNLAQCLLEQGRMGEALATARQGHQVALELKNYFPAGFGAVLSMLALAKTGDYPGARAMREEAGRLSDTAKVKYLEAALRLAEAQLHLELGEADAAGRAVEVAAALEAAVGDPVGVAKAAVARGRHQLLVGDVAGAEATLGAIDVQQARLLAAQVAVALAACAWHGAEAGVLRARAETALRLASELRAGELEAEANWLLAEACRRDGDPRGAQARYARVVRYGETAPMPLWEALGSRGLALVAVGAESANRRQHGEALLKRLAGSAGAAAYLAWPERQAAPVAAAAVGLGLAEAIAMVEDGRQAGSLAALIDRLLERVLGVAGAAAGGLLAYRNLELDGVATRFLKEDDLLAQPLVDTALWDQTPTFEAGRWALPVVDQGETVAVLYLEEPEAGRQEVVTHLVAAMALVIGQFNQMQRFVERVERLAFSESLARLALSGQPAEAILRQALRSALQFTHGERAMVLRSGEDFTWVLGLDAEGRPLPDDTRFSRSVCRAVVESGETVRLLDAQQMEGWQHAQSILALGLQTIIATPLRASGAIVGVLYVDSGDVVNLLGVREEALLEAGAEILGPLLTLCPPSEGDRRL